MRRAFEHDPHRFRQALRKPARLHLLKLCNMFQDLDGVGAELHYLLDRAGREVDFLVTVDGKPWFTVEAKVATTTIERSLRFFLDRLRIPWAYQITLDGQQDFVQDGIRCLPARQFFGALQ